MICVQTFLFSKLQCSHPENQIFRPGFITSFTADAVIIVGGGVGTLIEACVAYIKRKPIIALKGSGGIADKIAGKYLDERQLILVQEADDPMSAVKLADQLM